MPRTTDARVRETLDREYDSARAPALTQCIRRANVLTTRVATCASSVKNLPLTADELCQIETLLAAHFYQASDPGYASRSTLDASGQFLGQAGMGLERTRFGQDAMLLDYSGCLTAIAKRQFAGGDWLGKPPSDQISYEDRS